MFDVTHSVPRADVLLGVVLANGVGVNAAPPVFEERLGALLAERAASLTPEEERVRASVRDMLRNGRYKPTGRGKPASEYLMRASGEDGSAFPRINFPVDVCNYISLKFLVPISLWDVDLAGTSSFLFRLGRGGESYVFNSGGQVIDVTDLIVGCRLLETPEGEPIVNPVKDSLLTKTTSNTRRVAAAVYAPAGTVPHPTLKALCAEFSELLSLSAERAVWTVVAPGSTASLD